jgi:hypothetical protein
MGPRRVALVAEDQPGEIVGAIACGPPYVIAQAIARVCDPRLQ